MSLPRATFDPRRVFLFKLPNLSLGPLKREIGVYASGALFALGWWIFLDACILSARARPPPDSPHDVIPVHVSFADWFPGICGTLGMLLTNLIDKSHLLGDSSGGVWGGEGTVAWRARLFLFLGFALMAGGLAGSITVLVIKYIVPPDLSQYTYWGISSVVQNISIMLSACVLWLAQTKGDGEYEYQLAL